MNIFQARQKFLLAQLEQYEGVLKDFQQSRPEGEQTQVGALQDELNQLRDKVARVQLAEELVSLRKEVNVFLSNRWVKMLQDSSVKTAFKTEAEQQMVKDYRAAVDKAHDVDRVVRRLARVLEEAFVDKPTDSEFDPDVEKQITAIIAEVSQLDRSKPESQLAPAPILEPQLTEAQLPEEVWGQMAMESLKGKEIPRLAQTSTLFKKVYDEDVFYLKLIHRDLTKNPRFITLYGIESEDSVTTESPKAYYQRLHRDLLLPFENNQIANPLQKAVELGCEVVVSKCLQKMNTAEERQKAVLENDHYIIHFALHRSELEIFKILFEALTPEQKRLLVLNQIRGSFIYLATSANAPNELQALLKVLTPVEKQQIIETPRIEDGYSPLLIATKEGFSEVLSVLLAEFTPQQRHQLVLKLLLYAIQTHSSGRGGRSLNSIPLLLTDITLEELNEKIITPVKSSGLRSLNESVVIGLPETLLFKSLETNDALARSILSDPVMCATLIRRSLLSSMNSAYEDLALREVQFPVVRGVAGDLSEKLTEASVEEIKTLVSDARSKLPSDFLESAAGRFLKLTFDAVLGEQDHAKTLVGGGPSL